MKKEAVGHTKMKRLCRRLNLQTWQAVGLMELIWQITASETPEGDIGRLSDEDIALAIDYRGDEKVMIGALVDAGWVDQDPIFRLVIHDWFDHCPDYVHLHVARTKRYFVRTNKNSPTEVVVPKLTRLGGDEKKQAHEYYNSALAVRTQGARNSSLCAPPNLTLTTEEESSAPTPPSAAPSGPLAQVELDPTKNLVVVPPVSSARARTALKAPAPAPLNGNGKLHRHYPFAELWLSLSEPYPNKTDLPLAQFELLTKCEAKDDPQGYVDGMVAEVHRSLSDASWRPPALAKWIQEYHP